MPPDSAWYHHSLESLYNSSLTADMSCVATFCDFENFNRGLLMSHSRKASLFRTFWIARAQQFKNGANHRVGYFYR